MVREGRLRSPSLHGRRHDEGESRRRRSPRSWHEPERRHEKSRPSPFYRESRGQLPRPRRGSPSPRRQRDRSIEGSRRGREHERGRYRNEERYPSPRRSRSPVDRYSRRHDHEEDPRWRRDRDEYGRRGESRVVEYEKSHYTNNRRALNNIDGSRGRASHRSRGRSPVYEGPRGGGRRSRSPSSRSSSSSSSDEEGSGADEEEVTEEQLMAKLMGIKKFDTSKGREHVSSDLSGINKKTRRRYRQYMNRRGGFNRPLSPVF